MLTYQAHIISVLNKLVNEEIEMHKNALITAHTIFDHDGYKFTVGQVIGLQRAIELISEAQTLIEKGERG